VKLCRKRAVNDGRHNEAATETTLFTAAVTDKHSETETYRDRQRGRRREREGDVRGRVDEVNNERRDAEQKHEYHLNTPPSSSL